MDADRNCNFKGSTSIRLSKFSLEDSVSVLDGGGLVYSRTDCFVELTLADVKISQVRSNLVANGTLIPQIGQGVPLIDDLEGGGLIKITSNSLKVTVQNSILSNISSVTGVGGIFNFNQREYQGLFVNITAAAFNSKSAGTLMYLKSSSLTLNVTSNNIRCKDVA